MKLTYRFAVWTARVDRWHVALALGLLIMFATALWCACLARSYADQLPVYPAYFP
jgi:hypothetical protein